MDLDWSHWRSCHVHYHGDGDRLLLHLVHPLVATLLAAGAIDRFFFVRYELGGPHVRLRLRALPGRSGEVEAAVAEAATAFLALHPSVRPLPPETVERRTREILAADPGESDATLYPDNSFRFVPFLPEVDRYGGPERIGLSLDFFGLSSAHALELLRLFAGAPWPRRIPRVLCALAAHALGFARDEAELLRLLGYAAVPAGHPLASWAARGDRIFEERPEAFRALLASLAGAGETELLAAARRLAAGAGRAAPPARELLFKSHMHMTANRLGLRNPEEACVGRILWRAAHDSGRLAPGLREAWRPQEPPLDGGDGLEDLLRTVLSAMRSSDLGSTIRPGAGL
ncbi:MAG TPA: lantibiotic dehydratase C-terminal domain-containing protein [Thermoanaerobaculia bacterium]